ncbi:MAG: SUF system Fe-S cluster assembly regulator [Thermodesulfobacteriota bacterium]|jgi:FeS assembly SUF system regulator
MIRISKLTDYGIMLLTYIARDPLHARTARDLAVAAHLPLPTVSKVLKTLAREGLLVAHRGVKGGFSLARPPEQISVADIISALEGPIALTECSMHAPRLCQLEQQCPVGSNWQRINQAVLGALANLTLAAMTRPLPRHFVTLGDRRPVPVGGPAERVPARGEL